jgi:hypothetical protein
MIYPASYDITILQNATWSGVFRATQQREEVGSITVDGTTPTINLTRHGYSAGTKVVFTGGTLVPRGLSLNTIYYVISTGLTADAFQVSETSGGASISVSGSATGTFYVAQPLDLTDYTVDADIKGLADFASITTFTPTLSDAVNGEFTLTISPTITAGLDPGRYGYDVSLTSLAGARYYWLTGVATVKNTYSRN